jgi:alkylation response protein AidB-like acyl-CoA dehydrogenase
VRYLDSVESVCAFRAEGVVVGTVTPDMVETVDSVVAYPMGKLKKLPEDAFLYKGKIASSIRRRALIGIAAEAAGAMRGALEHTVRYVKERQQFGQPLGNFQGIQHRLAEDAQLVRACRWLAFKAAYNDDDGQAAVACLYAQDAIRKVINDCHQFCGAMGLTLEFPLHLWTYRLKVLQGEAGGRATQAQDVARQVWGGASCQTDAA